MPIKTIIAATAVMCLIWAGDTFSQDQVDEPRQPPAQPRKAEESIASLEQRAAAARQEENWSRLYGTAVQLNKRLPFAPEYMLEIIRAAAALDRRQTAYHFMLKMQQQGLSYDLDEMPETAGMRDAEAYDYIKNLMIEAGQPAGEGRLVMSLPGNPRDLGDIAWDETRERFLVGTRHEGRLLAVTDQGETEELLRAGEENGLWSLDGLAVDAERNTLWIASTASPAFAGYSAADARRGGLFEFRLDTLELAGRYNLPADGLPHSLGSIALTDEGHVYVIDRRVPVIYLKRPDGDRLERFVGLPGYVALTDISATPDNSRLFVADAVMGLVVIDPIAGRLAPLGGPENLNQYGIYGVDYTGDSLVITQSGIEPQRLMKLKLDAAGAAVADVTPMAVALEGFDTPGVGTLRGDSIYYFANHGAPSGGDTLNLMATPLEAGESIEAPDMRLFQKALKERLEKEQGEQQQ